LEKLKKEQKDKKDDPKPSIHTKEKDDSGEILDLLKDLKSLEVDKKNTPQKVINRPAPNTKGTPKKKPKKKDKK